MAVDATTSAASSSSAVSSALGRTRLAENFDTFLTLLTTQMKNQDPTSPMDATQFTQQLVQMTGVEQQLQTNDLLKQLVGNTSSGISAAVSLIGKEVRAVSSEAALAGGDAKWTYTLDRPATDVKLEILDSRGRVVRVIAPTDNRSGEHQLTWDGKGDGGSTLPDGLYSLRVTAKDTQGTNVGSTVFTDGLVTGVEQADGQTLITVNGAKVLWDKVTTIRQPAEEASADENDNPDDKTSSPAAA